MMAFDTVLQQGRFTSTGIPVDLNIRSDVDWIWVYNETVLNDAAAAADLCAQFYFQRGMTNGRGVEYRKLGTVANDPITTLQSAPGAGIFLIDSTVNIPASSTAVTGLTAANPPVVTAAGHGLLVGDIVRFDNLDNQPQIAGIDFSVTATGVTFQIGNINLTNSTASTAGFVRRIPFDPIFYPRRRSITYVSTEAQAKIYLSVTHGFTVGQKVRLQFPGGSSVWGNFAILDGVEATILDINLVRAGNEPNNGGVANNIRVDVDTSALGNWNVFGAANNEAYPGSAAIPFSPAQVVPFGEDTAEALSQNVNILEDATRNTAFMGARLMSGVNGPAGQVGDVIYWVAGKSFSVDNQ